ncbi:hypothetical protein WR25_13601 [Diploscapter pachys]|uniref:DNA/RNA-binding protein Kin17 WH-like domain-containing protein n=1 Tax=Diploscapter pachys TaxID=2018661 RepID=A0A2A2KNM9_9BILA|nr:hypothetical protein WR25_13601 [Diploscapter pachys]
MGKHEKGTPKEIANRTKSKGLQKLRWYCQMCQKQCRDQNGFKCHLTSESHQRQILLFAENANSFLRQFSNEFETSFLRTLRMSYGTKRVRANEVYQEIVKNKGHTHMNSTVWHTLTGFILYLGSSGKCKIDKNEKGWWIQYIDKEAELRKEEEVKKMKAEKDDEERHLEMMNVMVERGKELAGEDFETPAPTELIRNDDEKIQLNLNLNVKPSLEDLNKPCSSLIGNVFNSKVKSGGVKKEEPDDEDESERDDRPKKRKRSGSPSKERERERDRHERKSRDSKYEPESSRKSALDEIREMEEIKKEKKNRKDHWLHEGIIVKIVTKKLGDKFYKAKGMVKKLIDEYTASVKLDDGTTVKLDQSHVETVIPSVGRKMLVVNGAYRGSVAVLESLDEKKFCVNLTIDEGVLKGRKISAPYEDASKLA